MLPRDVVILKILDAEIGPAKVLEAERIESVSLAMEPRGAEC